MSTYDDTIFALASNPGRSAIAIVRISGPGTGAALTALSRAVLPHPRRATRASLCNPCTGDVLDRGLILWFPAPYSFTGEDVAELHLHGGRAVISGVTEALAALPGLRPATPGEFTRRAFEHGKIDLTEAEAIADLVDAETSAQRHQALRQLDGQLASLYESWRTRLVQLLAHLEAIIDFSDEDLPSDLEDQISEQLTKLIADLDAHLHDGRRGERLRDGLSVTIIGPPNAGKSSLLNKLARRDVAIVSEQSGTTRDIIEVHLDLGGFPVVLADTAGLRNSSDLIEAEGVQRALRRAAQADVKLAIFDGATWPHQDPVTTALLDSDTLVVVNKCDLIQRGHEDLSTDGPLKISALTGVGIPELLNQLTTMVSKRADTTGGPTLTRLRHRVALQDCREALSRARLAFMPELIAEDIRLASRALGRITGKVSVDEILDVIFRDFCIGK